MRNLLSRQDGGALIEFALILPLLLACALPVFDYMSNIAAQTVLTNAARETANLAKRPAQTLTLQEIMNQVGDSTPPFDMKNNGSLLITKIVGNRGCDARGEQCSGSVVEQTRWGFGTTPVSKILNCLSWKPDGSGQCANLGAHPDVALLSNRLYQGQIVMVAEAQYTQTPLVAALNLGFMGISIPGLDPHLYASAFF